MPSRWESRRHRSVALGGLITFGAGFGFVEAAVVYYLRTVLGSPDTYSLGRYRVLANLGFVTFVNHLQSFLPVDVERVEVAREVATIVMLAAVAVALGRSATQRWGAFFVGFATWDLAYYLFLRLISGWPQSLFTRDVYFLIPVPWIGPVITPLVISCFVLYVGVILFRRG